jgi:hypothetical protein
LEVEGVAVSEAVAVEVEAVDESGEEGEAAVAVDPGLEVEVGMEAECLETLVALEAAGWQTTALRLGLQTTLSPFLE